MISVVNHIADIGNMRKLFKDDSIKINYEKLSLAGHSFGAATAAFVATANKNVTGSLIMLDPWLYPASDLIGTNLVKTPTLIIRTISFEEYERETFMSKERNMRFIDENAYQVKDRSICCSFEFSTHEAQVDLVYLIPREMTLFGLLGSVTHIEDLVDMQDMLT